ncbi:MAG: hypothetical protein MUF78_04630 [Candidatus Edwardsbacteria bacterium]|jgi:hypothetical protein|nr:hypothetical protein [Candidatus Edwardsbacteria bacterium]
MAGQTVTFQYDADRNILFAVDDYEIASERDADEFLALYERELGAIGAKPYLVVGIDGLLVGAKVDAYYGRRAKEVVERNILGFARYGSNAVSRMSVRTAALKAALEVNIFNTRDEATAAVERMKLRPPAPAQ